MALKSAAFFLSLLPLTAIAAFASAPVRELRSPAWQGIQKKRDLDIPPSTLYRAYNLSVPVDHFHNETSYEPHSNGTFPLRYWFDPTYYRPGGPVIVLESGETSGEGRLPFLQKGIVRQLAEATNGLGVVLERKGFFFFFFWNYALSLSECGSESWDWVFVATHSHRLKKSYHANLDISRSLLWNELSYSGFVQGKLAIFDDATGVRVFFSFLCHS